MRRQERKEIINKLDEHIKDINKIRNHIAHNLVKDLDLMHHSFKEFYTNTPIDMAYKGNELDLENHYKYITEFFSKLN